MITKYFATDHGVPKIEKMEVNSETMHSVFHGHRLHRKKTAYSGYFDTFEHAKKFLEDISVREHTIARQSMERATKKLMKVMELTDETL